MRIGTWNVYFASAAKQDAISSILSENGADIWILTETHDTLKPPSARFAVHSDPRPKKTAGHRWVTIWSRYRIIEQVSLPLSAGRERTAAALLDLGNDQALLIYGTVLPWKDDRCSGWSAHHRTITDQHAQWLELRRKYPSAALCVAGDYNTDMMDGRRYGTKQGISALRSAMSDCSLFCATDPGRVPNNFMLPKLPIDHIALPLAWEHRTTVVAAWPANAPTHSDHSGIVVDVGGVG
jgi:exonuclease III